MFDDKVIVPDSLANLPDGQGFSVAARLPYYRGLGLSMIEDIAVSLNGEPFSRDDVRFSVRGNTWTLDEMENEHGDRWNFGEAANVEVHSGQPLEEGEHEITVAIRMRVSYLPFVPTTTCTKTLKL